MLRRAITLILALGLALGSFGANFVFALSFQQLPNDPLLSRQFIYFDDVGVVDAWNIEKGQSGTVVAVIDTGVNFYHEDLIGKAWTNFDEIAGNGRDDDGNGYIDDVNGYNFEGGNNDIVDVNGHGTAIASIITARTNNAKGISGVAWGAKIMALRALDQSGNGGYKGVAEAIHYAVDNGASIVNMSFGTDVPVSELADAVKYAADRNVILVSATGNEGIGRVLYPAAYEDVLAVAAINRLDVLASYSNYGPEVDLVAPGDHYVVAGLDNPTSSTAYSEASGTSFAAALVSGSLVLLKSHYPNIANKTLVRIVKDTADPLSFVGPSLFYGHGRLNILRALQGSGFDQATVQSSKSSVSADGIDLANITLNLKNSNGQPGVSKNVALSTNHELIINGQTFVAKESLIGSTDANGNLNFQISSNKSGRATLSFYNQSDGGLINVSLELNFAALAKARHEAEWVSQSANPTLSSGELANLQLKLRNTGNVAWVNGGSSPLVLGTDKEQDRNSTFYHGSWLGSNRAAKLKEGVVLPNQVGIFEFTIQAPLFDGNFREYFRPVIEHVAWLNDLGVYWDIQIGDGSTNANFVPSGEWSAQVVSQTPSPVRLVAGQLARLRVEYQNTGSAQWFGSGSNAVTLGTSGPRDRWSSLKDFSWLSANRVKIISTDLVRAGETTVIEFLLEPPAKPGTYNESFELVAEYVSWVVGSRVNWQIIVE